MNIFITGVAGFIGYHLSKRFLSEGHRVYGVDNVNDYYDVNLKLSRLSQLKEFERFHFTKCDLLDYSALDDIFKNNKISHVINLAAQAGVRYSLENPRAYIDTNLNGFFNILEMCRHYPPEHLVFASSSSVYGLNTKMPFSVRDSVDHPISLYAATKKSNELLAHSYSHIYKIPSTGLRFFTVYGPWGRPDMALFLFTKAILNDEPINVFNNGEMQRDFTYIDDIIEGVVRVTNKPPKANPEWNSDQPDPSSSPGPYKIFNIGNNNTVSLMHFINTIEDNLGKTAKKNMLPLQTGDVPATYANIDDLFNHTGFRPQTTIETGIKNFISWYRDYYCT